MQITPLINIIQLNESVIKEELKELVRCSVEDTLNGLLDQEAQELVNAGKYERSAVRLGVSKYYTLLAIYNSVTIDCYTTESCRVITIALSE